jgi:hypothetical protein
MTKGQFFGVVLLVAAVLFAVFVWPTRYRDLSPKIGSDGVAHSMRVDRLTERVEMQNASGEWVEYAPPPEFNSMDTPTGHAVGKTNQAMDDIRKMNEVSKEATSHESPLK